MSEQRSRRRYMRDLGTAVVIGSLAGCSGDGGDGDGGGESGDTTPAETPTDSPTPTPTPTPTETPRETPAETPTPAPQETPTATPTGLNKADIDEYLSDTDNYDGSIVDGTGQDEVSVDVGADGNGGGFAFGPPAIRIETGTTVVWEWTGVGGLHNVVAKNGAFDSGDPISDPDTTFEFTFTETGTWLYFCTPHRALGMKGAVVVE